MKNLLCLLLAGALAKDHFIVNEGPADTYNEHRMVKAG